MKLKDYIFILSSLSLSLWILTACEKDTVYYSYQPIPFKGWGKTDTLTYVLPNELTGKTYQLEIGIRHNETYPFRDIWIEFHHPLLPDSTTEKIHIQLAGENGRWYGKGNAGNLYQYTEKGPELVLQPGDSIIQIIHVMNTTLLQGISDIGIRLSLPRGINPQKDEQKNGEPPQGGASITEERERNADNRSQPQNHTYIDKQMKE